MSAADLAAVRVAIEGAMVGAWGKQTAHAALDLLAARLERAERERQKADEELADKVGVEKALLAAEAREAALREALDYIEEALGGIHLDELPPRTQQRINEAWARAREKRPDPKLVPAALAEKP